MSLSKALGTLRKYTTPEYKSPAGPRITVLGIAQTGKSTCVGCLHLTLTDLANQKKLRYRVHEYEQAGKGAHVRILGQRQSASQMREGKFPEPTPKDQVFEADMTIIWRDRWGREREVAIPVIDIAGEEVTGMIENLSKGPYEMLPVQSLGRELYEKIWLSNGIILIMDTTLALAPRTDRDIDVDLSHVIEIIYDYKRKMLGGEDSLHNKVPPLKSVTVLFTKYDQTADQLLGRTIDLRTDDGRNRFMSIYFPETYGILNFFGLQNVLFLPVYVDLLYGADGKPMINPRGGKPLIKVDVNRSPSYSRISYLKLIDWIKENFVA